ncbi:MAG: hypothetical protein IT378_01150 [Sandaracinaceae bacterium]|nr:hypothetical protein [Sandaracinaceae bacterium]
MTSDEARDLFSEALEDELGERKQDFDAALSEDDELREEYAMFVATFRTVGGLAETDADDAPDLLEGVQERLRKRSKGRFYRDRFSQGSGPGWTMPLLVGAAMLIVLGIAWIFLQTSVVLEETPPQRSQQAEPAR